MIFSELGLQTITCELDFFRVPHNYGLVSNNARLRKLLLRDQCSWESHEFLSSQGYR